LVDRLDACTKGPSGFGGSFLLVSDPDNYLPVEVVHKTQFTPLTTHNKKPQTFGSGLFIGGDGGNRTRRILSSPKKYPGKMPGQLIGGGGDYQYILIIY